MTIAEIAKQANVSIGTVDRVIHNRGRVSQKTIERVHSVIKENGFEPNQYARNLRLNKQYKFGVLLRDYPEGENTYWEIMHDGCVAAAKDLKSLSAELVFAYYGDITEKSLYEAGKELLEKGIDGMILSPNTVEDVQRLLPELGGMPYAFVNTGFADASPIIDTSQDCEIAGRTVGRLMSLLRPEGRLFVTIKRETQSNSTKERILNFIKYFEGNKEIKIVNCVIDHKGDVEKQVHELLAPYPAIDGIFIVNTATSMYVENIDKLGLKERPAIIGYDAVPKNVAMLENNRIDCLISQQPFSQGYNAVQQMYFNQVLGNKEPADARAPVTVIFKENLNTYKAAIRERFY